MDEFREKGVIGAMKDAALDTKDMAKDAGGWLWEGVKSVVDSDTPQAVLRCPTVPARGAAAPLELANGDVVQATVLDIDGVSQPPRARVTYEGLEEPLLVHVLEPDAPFPIATSTAGVQAASNMFSRLQEEVNDTVKDFQEKGAVATFKDAALDAVDIVSTAGSKAVEVAAPVVDKASTNVQSYAKDLLDLEWTPEDAADPKNSDGAQKGGILGFVDGLKEGIKEEVRGTVQDFREKGAVATFKDAALDAVDIVGSTASTVVEGTKSVAAPILEQASSNMTDLWSAPTEALAADNSISGSAPSASSTSPAEASPTPTPAAASSSSSSPAPDSAPAVSAVAAPAAAAAAAAPQGGGYAAAQVPKAPEQPAEESREAEGKPARKSIVSMRRNMFEKKDEPKKDEEEMID